MATLGAWIVSIAEGEVHIELPFSEKLSQQHGYLHAGAITSIVDSACGYAALTKAPAEHEVVTAEFKINLMRPAIGERFLAIGSKFRKTSHGLYRRSSSLLWHSVQSDCGHASNHCQYSGIM